MFITVWKIFPDLGTSYPYDIFFLASYVATFFLGGGPGALIILLGFIAGTFFLGQPYDVLLPVQWNDVMDLTLYFFSSILTIVTIEYLQRTRYKSDLLLRVAESRYKILLHRENQRLLLSRKVDNAEVASAAGLDS